MSIITIFSFLVAPLLVLQRAQIIPAGTYGGPGGSPTTSTMCLLVTRMPHVCYPAVSEDSEHQQSRVGPTPPSEGKLFIIGGGSRPDAMVSRLIKESGLDKGGYAVVLPMSSSYPPDSSVFWASQPFLAQGIDHIYGVHFSTPEGSTQAKADSVRNAKLIYITGGDQVRFMKIVGGTSVEQAIMDAYKSGATIAGTSAGAALMSKTMLTGNQLKYTEYESTYAVIEANNMETSRGLGLLDQVIIDQHFVVRSRHNRLITAVIELDNVIGIGIDESTAILVKGNEAEVVGNSQVIVITKPKAGKKVVKDKLGAKGLRMDVYLEGEKFAIGK